MMTRELLDKLIGCGTREAKQKKNKRRKEEEYGCAYKEG